MRKGNAQTPQPRPLFRQTAKNGDKPCHPINEPRFDYRTATHLFGARKTK